MAILAWILWPSVCPALVLTVGSVLLVLEPFGWLIWLEALEFPAAIPSGCILGLKLLESELSLEYLAFFRRGGEEAGRNTLSMALSTSNLLEAFS